MLNTLCNGIFVVLSVFTISCTQHHSLISPKSHDSVYGQISENDDMNNDHESVYPCADEVDVATVNAQMLGELSGVYQNRINPYPVAGNEQGVAISPGDVLDIHIENGDGFTGKYTVNSNGYIHFPGLPMVAAKGHYIGTLQKEVERLLVKEQLFRPNTAHVTIRYIQLSSIDVSVIGAVFEPGRVRINLHSKVGGAPAHFSTFGDFSVKRLITEAIRSASGIRPDADLQQVQLVRNGWQMTLDLSGIFTGRQIQDITLIAGDKIIIPTTGCFQRQLVRPSHITPKGFRVFLSNLTVPAYDNASSTVGRYSSNLPYGSRLLQAAIAANCVGGIQLTNASRKIVLASKNLLNGKMQVKQFSIEDVFKQAHKEDNNPYLMPNDAVACYDSDVTNFRDIARSITDIVSPLKIIF